jgi:hypothetical protein
VAGMMKTLEQEIIDYTATEMSRNMDWEILADVRCRMGWYRIDLDCLQDNQHAVDISWWLNENCVGKYHRNGRYFLFNEQSDAVLFKLRWA